MKTYTCPSCGATRTVGDHITPLDIGCGCRVSGHRVSYTNDNKTTMRTPLPEKIDGEWMEEGSLAHKLNQIITYLAELTEVVEENTDAISKSGLINPKWIPEKKTVVALGAGGSSTPTLKETLLNELMELDFRTKQFGKLRLADVEEIVNRLIL